MYVHECIKVCSVCVYITNSPPFSWNNNPFATSRNQLQQFAVLMVPLCKILDNAFDSVAVFKRRTFVGTKQVLPHRAVQYQTWQIVMGHPIVHSVVRQWILWTRVLFVLQTFTFKKMHFAPRMFFLHQL